MGSVKAVRAALPNPQRGIELAIYKRPGSKNWQIEFVFEGRRCQKTAKTGDKRAAQNIESKWKADLAQGLAGLAQRKTARYFSEFADECMDAVRVRIAKPRTIEFYEAQTGILKAFEPLAKVRLTDIDERLIEAFVQHRSGQVSNASVNRALSTLRKFLGMAFEWKHIDRIPKVKKLGGEQIREFVLTTTQEMAYFEAAPQPLKDIATLLIDTGLRCSEALNLTWADVRLEGDSNSKLGSVTVREGKSVNARRTVALTHRVREMLERRKEKSQESKEKSPEHKEKSQSSYVFATKSGVPMLASSLSHLHCKARKAAGLTAEFVLHSLRHTFLTRLGELGVDAFVIQKIAGHYSIVVSQRYVHPSRSAMENALALLDTRNAALAAVASQ